MEQLTRYGSKNNSFEPFDTELMELLKPQILQMSGIGPNKVLKDAGIDVKLG